jgi:nicotinamide-nucleotide amidase
VAQRLSTVIDAHPQVVWAFYPGTHGVDVKLRSRERDATHWDAVQASVRELLDHSIYTENADETMSEVVGRLLNERHLGLAVAESCTGGLVGGLVTDVPGSSAYFAGGFITYSDALKRDWLGVPDDLLRAHGAVSAEVAAAMARGCRERAKVDLALGVTGIAGPSGGTAEKPVGLVYLALASAAGCWTRRLQIGLRRDLNRQFSSQLALDLVRRHLQGRPVGDPA